MKERFINLKAFKGIKPKVQEAVKKTVIKKSGCSSCGKNKQWLFQWLFYWFPINNKPPKHRSLSGFFGGFFGGSFVCKLSSIFVLAVIL